MIITPSLTMSCLLTDLCAEGEHSLRRMQEEGEEAAPEN